MTITWNGDAPKLVSLILGLDNIYRIYIFFYIHIIVSIHWTVQQPRPQLLDAEETTIFENRENPLLNALEKPSGLLIKEDGFDLFLEGR